MATCIWQKQSQITTAVRTQQRQEEERYQISPDAFMKGPVLSVVLPEDMQDGTKLLIKNSPDMESKSASGDERLVSPHRDDDTDVAGESEDGLKGSLTKTSHDYEGMESSCEPSSSHPLSPSQDTIPSQSLDTIPNASLEEDSKPPSHSMSDFQPPGVNRTVLRARNDQAITQHPPLLVWLVDGRCLQSMPVVQAWMMQCYIQENDLMTGHTIPHRYHPKWSFRRMYKGRPRYHRERNNQEHCAEGSGQ